MYSESGYYKSYTTNRSVLMALKRVSQVTLSEKRYKAERLSKKVSYLYCKKNNKRSSSTFDFAIENCLSVAYIKQE